MEQIKINLHILYILVAVIISCEARFRHPGHISIDEEDYDDEEAASIPVTFVYNRMKVPDSEGPPTNVIFNGAPYKVWNPDGRYTHPHSANKGRLLSYKGLQASKAEINPYTSYLTPSGQYRGIYPARNEKVNSDRGPSFYNRPLLSPEDMGYPNPPRISNKVDFDSRSRVYDGFQATRPDQNKVYVDNRSRLQKFRRPNGQAKMVHPGPYGESSEWNYNKNPANEESYPNRYLLIRSIRDNSTFRERGDPALQDNFAPYDSYVDPDDYYVIDVKKRFKADYNLSL